MFIRLLSFCYSYNLVFIILSIITLGKLLILNDVKSKSLPLISLIESPNPNVKLSSLTSIPSVSVNPSTTTYPNVATGINGEAADTDMNAVIFVQK